MENQDKRQLKDFSKLKSKLRVHRSYTPTSNDSYLRLGFRRNNPVFHTFTLQEITDIIQNGDPQSLRELSRFYYRTNGIYRNNIDLLAALLKYDTITTPIFDINKKVNRKSIMDTFYQACSFVEELNVPINFCRISHEMLITGVYYGILRSEGTKHTIQDLPVSFCRSRFKDFNNLDVLEFNLHYFEKISDDNERAAALLTFPIIVQQAYKKWEKKKTLDPWIEIPAEAGGICFGYGDRTPLLISAIPSLYKMEEAVEREGRRDENELYKLLIQKMPIDNKGELVFELEEVADIHESIADMLQDRETIDVLTTFGDTSLESLQDSTAASQSSDRINKYKTSAFDALGRSAILFNADGSNSLAYSIQRDEALMISISNLFANWIRFQINHKFARPNLTFDFTILPTTIFNQEKIQKQYFQGAQYGYSKMYAGVALGIKQTNQLSLMTFENEYLKMHEKMIPLQSSYTTSGTEVAGETKNKSSAENGVKNSNGGDLNNEGGRPTLDDTQKSEKTEANQKAEG